MNGNRKLFWKEVSKANGGNVENCSKIKDENGVLALEEVEVQRIWKEYFEDLFIINTYEQVALHICGLDGIRRSTYFVGELIRGKGIEVRVGKLKNRKAAGKGEVTGDVRRRVGMPKIEYSRRSKVEMLSIFN